MLLHARETIRSSDGRGARSITLYLDDVLVLAEIELMSEQRNQPTPGSQAQPERRSDAFGKNLLAVTYIAPDFYDDLPQALSPERSSRSNLRWQRRRWRIIGPVDRHHLPLRKGQYVEHDETNQRE